MRPLGRVIDQLVIDGLPLAISRSQNDFVRRITKSRKYKDFVVKLDLMTTLCGFTCDYGFTRRGVMNDGPLHRRNKHRISSMFDWEFFLGDKA